MARLVNELGSFFRRMIGLVASAKLREVTKSRSGTTAAVTDLDDCYSRFCATLPSAIHYSGGRSCEARFTHVLSRSSKSEFFKSCFIQWWWERLSMEPEAVSRKLQLSRRSTGSVEFVSRHVQKQLLNRELLMHTLAPTQELAAGSKSQIQASLLSRESLKKLETGACGLLLVWQVFDLLYPAATRCEQRCRVNVSWR